MNTQPKREYASYHVGLKILLKKEDQYLFLTSAYGTCFDLPGGRIDTVEHQTRLSDVVRREVREELGDDVIYTLGKPAFHFRRHFEERGVHVFLIVYEAEFVSGDIQLSNEHSIYQWINPYQRALTREDFLSEEEYVTFKEYFGTQDVG